MTAAPARGWSASRFPAAPYPGTVPPFSYVLHEGMVLPLVPTEGDYLLDGQTTLTEWLAAKGQRCVPLLAYGSNACPGRLIQKFPGAGGDGVVLLQGQLTGAVRVWSRKPSSSGSVPLTLAHAPGHRSPAHLMLLPAGLAAAMDRSEGRHGPYYALARLDLCALELTSGTLWERPLAYVGHSERGPLLCEGAPVTDLQVNQHAARQMAALGGSSAEGDVFLPTMSVVAPDVPLGDALCPVADDPLTGWLSPHPPVGEGLCR